MRVTTIPVAVVLLAGSGSLLAAEVPVWDIGLVAEARPSAFSFTWSRDGAERSGDDAFDRAWAAGLGAQRGFSRPGAAWQWLLGGQLLWLDERFGAGGRSGPLLRLTGDWGWGLGDELLLTAGLAAGAGRVRFALPGGIFGDQTLDGTVLEGGPRLGLRWAPAAHLALAAEAGWLVGRDRHDGDGIALSIERSGPWLGIGLAWILDPRPRRVE